MHDYAIDSDKRRKATLIVAVIYLLLVTAVALLGLLVETILSSQPFWAGVNTLQQKSWWSVLESVLGFVVPGIEIGAAYALFDQHVWKLKWITRFHKIPDFNGDWIAHIYAPLKHPSGLAQGGFDSEIHMQIKQTWTKIAVTGISDHGTRTDSYTASIAEKNNRVIFSYSYYIEPSFGRGSGQMYRGFNSLYYENGKLEGEYFSGKDVIDIMETDFMQKVTDPSARMEIRKGLEGCGSKGRIILRKM